MENKSSICDEFRILKNVIFENQKSKQKVEIIIKDAYPSDMHEFMKFLDSKFKETGIKDRKDWFIETFNVSEKMPCP